MSCLICSSDSESILDLGFHSFSNALLETQDAPSPTYPLVLCRCSSCGHLQISFHADPEELFTDYPWVTGTSHAARTFSEQLSSLVITNHTRANPKSLPNVVEVASNDGTFLQPFLQKGCQVIGFEPAKNIHAIAVQSGVPTECEFFSDISVSKILSLFPDGADAVIARNVVPHTPDPVGMLRSISDSLTDTGLAYIEFHDAASILRGLQYDSIYHEHFSYFTLETISFAAKCVGLTAVDVIPSPISGGALIVVLTKNSEISPSKQLKDKALHDKQISLSTAGSWHLFAERSRAHSQLSKQLILAEIESNRTVYAFGSSARSNTYLSFASIDSTLITSVFDNNPLKHGRFTPGTRIPIVTPDWKALNTQSTLLLCAWNFSNEIEQQLLEMGKSAQRLIKPFPGDPELYILQ